MHCVQQKATTHVQLSRVENWINIAIDNPENKTIKIYMGKKPEYDAINTLVSEDDGNLFVLNLPAIHGPYYFYYQLGNQNSNIFSERIIPLTGAINVRDMGGYETRDGRRVKWGMLYRGDQLSKLDDDDVTMLEKLQIKTIIDYRSEHERSVSPNKELKTVKQVVSCDPQSEFSEAAAQAVDLEDENEKLVAELKSGMIPERYINGKGLKVIESYRNFAYNSNSQEAYKKVMKTYVDIETAPSIQHCRGGKDRTGFGAMLLLLLLGVKLEDVIYDYTLTGVLRQERNTLKLGHYKQLTDNEDYLAYLMSLIETRAEFIEESLNAINEKYGDIETYAKEVFAVTENDINQMKQYYLEEGSVWGR